MGYGEEWLSIVWIVSYGEERWDMVRTGRVLCGW